MNGLDLLKGLVHVRDGLTLFAFLSLVILVAFRTKKVPELLFGLVRDKLTRNQFSALLNRFMILLFAAFVIVVLLATLAQVLNQKTQARVLTIEDLRNELARSSASEDQKLHAESQYTIALEKLAKRDLDGAIASLQDSIKAVPTLTAQETITYLYRQKGDFRNESTAWEGAVKLARAKGDTLALVRLDNAAVPESIPDMEGEHDLIGPGASLPAAGDTYETATTIDPGLYRCIKEGGCFWPWYKVDLNAGSTLQVKLRSPPTGGLTGATIFGTNGEQLTAAGDSFDAMRGNAKPRGNALCRQLAQRGQRLVFHSPRIGFRRRVPDRRAVRTISTRPSGGRRRLCRSRSERRPRHEGPPSPRVRRLG